MPVRLFTFHAYRSWTEDNPRGYMQRGRPGVRRPNPALARYRAATATFPPVRFGREQQRLLIQCAQDICREFDCRLHASAATVTHVHLLVSWRDRQSSAGHISARLKRNLGHRLSRHMGATGHRWFSRGDDQKAVRDRAHFDHLCSTYLPRHVNENGLFWREGMSAPITRVART